MNNKQQADLTRRLMKLHTKYIEQRISDDNFMTPKQYLELSLSPLIELLAHGLISAKMRVDDAANDNLDIHILVNQTFQSLNGMISRLQEHVYKRVEH